MWHIHSPTEYPTTLTCSFSHKLSIGWTCLWISWATRFIEPMLLVPPSLVRASRVALLPHSATLIHCPAPLIRFWPWLYTNLFTYLLTYSLQSFHYSYDEVWVLFLLSTAFTAPTVGSRRHLWVSNCTCSDALHFAMFKSISITNYKLKSGRRKP